MFAFWRTKGWYRKEVVRLQKEASRLFQRGLYTKALGPATQALDLARRHLGEDHPEFATSLDDLAEVYKGARDYARAEPLYRQALEIRRKALGEAHPHFATILDNLGVLYT